MARRVNPANTPPDAPVRPHLTMRQALWIAFASLLLAVTSTLLIASYAGTRILAQEQADLLLRSVQRETDSRLHRIFDPIRQKVTEDYASIRVGRYTTKEPERLKDRLYANLFSLPQIDSLMVGDLSGSQFLVMRYTPAVRNSPVLAPIAATLPDAPVGPALQFFTRDFRPAEWGELSRWTLWDEIGRTPLQAWQLPLIGYDGRLRPWHRAALARFADMPLDEAHMVGAQLIAWTEVYPLFTTKKPGISASVAARDPTGQILIVAYDLLLDEIAQFTRTARPTTRGQLLILTEDDRLLGPPSDDSPGPDESRAAAAIMRPVAEAGYPLAAHATAVWRDSHAHAAGQIRLRFEGERWWAGFVPFEIGAGRLLWIAVLLPESDLVPATQAHQRMILIVGAVALLLATIAAVLLARRLSTPLATLAGQARRIARLDLAPEPPVQSPVVELATLSETIVETRNSLREGIAAREQAIRALATSEQQLRTLAENTPDVIVRLDLGSRYLFANPAHEVATGLPAAAILGRTIAEVGHPPELVAAWRTCLDQTIATRQPAAFDFSYATPVGRRYFEARLLLEPATSERGDTILGVFHDVTERAEAAAALARSQLRYRTLIESALVGIIVHQDGLIRFANSAAHALFGLARAAATDDWGWETYIAPAYRDELKARADAALRGEHPPLHPGWQLVRPDGTHRWVQSSVTSIEWDGHPALLSFIRDITDLHLANERQAALEDQLRHAQKLEAVGLLAGGIAHDFNNLLQIIGGNAEFAAADDVSPQEQRDCVREIAKSVQRASEMTRQLLAFSRRQALAREHTDLNDFVGDHVRMLRRVLPETIQLQFRPATRPLIVLADRGQLEQVLLNLCLNARDAMPRGGHLSLELAAISGETAPHPAEAGAPLAELRVADTGQGMDDATRERIFEPFFTTKSRDKGTGLGLAVVYGIIHQHGGAITVASRPGEGAVFTIHLPLQTAQAPAPALPPRPRGKSRVAGGRVLLAEDNAPIRRIAVAALRHAGYNVHAVADGIEAAEYFEQHAGNVDLLFFDVMMPRLNGFEAAERCRALRPDIPVIFASGYAAESVGQHEAVPAGAQVLPKPYRAEVLLELVAGLLAAREDRTAGEQPHS